MTNQPITPEPELHSPIAEPEVTVLRFDGQAVEDLDEERLPEPAEPEVPETPVDPRTGWTPMVEDPASPWWADLRAEQEQQQT